MARQGGQRLVHGKPASGPDNTQAADLFMVAEYSKTH